MDGGDGLMQFPRLHETLCPPLAGYDSYRFCVLLNPTGAEKNDWFFGNLGQPDCADCQKLNPKRVEPHANEASDRVYCPVCTEARARFGRAAVAIFGESRVQGFDFADADAALASFEQSALPDELLSWLFMAPAALWASRVDDLKKKLLGPLATES
jgi:hypothetical protein